MSLTKFPIKNTAVLSILEDFRYTYRELYRPENTNTCLFPEMKGMADLYTGEDEMWRIIDMGEEHDGAASNSVCYAIKPDHYNGTHPEEYSKTWINLNTSLTEELGVQHSALYSISTPRVYWLAQ